jgi:hypothetical protein
MRLKASGAFVGVIVECVSQWDSVGDVRGLSAVRVHWWAKAEETKSAWNERRVTGIFFALAFFFFNSPTQSYYRAIE